MGPLKLGTSPELARSELALAEWIRDRRRSMRMTQEEVIKRVRKAGIVMSRGHLSNLETGAYPLRPDHVLALDRALEADGLLISRAERVWQRPINGLLPADLVEIGKSMYRLLVLDAASRPVDLAKDGLDQWWRDRTKGDSFVVQGRDDVEAVMLDLLALAAKQPPSESADPIALAGAFEGFRSGRPGLPKPVRGGLRQVMERGHECRHYIPSDRDDLDETTLVYIVAPLLACPRFKARMLDPKISATVENMLVIPGLAAVQFYATDSAKDIDAAVIHTGLDARRVLERRISQLREVSSEFVTRYPRNLDDETRGLTDAEVSFRRRLAEISTIKGPARAVLAHFPTATNPPEVYRARLDRRKDDPFYIADQSDVADIVTLQARRYQALREHLERGLPYQVVVPMEQFELPADDTVEWHRSERKAQFEYLLELLAEFPSFELGFAAPVLEPGVKACQWEVRESQARSVVIVQASGTVGPPVDGKPQLQPVDILITQPGCVKAFSSYFQDMWGRSVRSERPEIEALLKAALRE